MNFKSLIILDLTAFLRLTPKENNLLRLFSVDSSLIPARLTGWFSNTELDVADPDEDGPPSARPAGALSGLFVTQQQNLVGCHAGMESTSPAGGGLLMRVPRPWNRGNWARMVSVRAPLPPTKQRPPPRQAVRDGETNPS